MESPLGSGRAGIRIQDFFLPVRELRLGWASESASMAGMVGDGTTGDLTGITTVSFTTTTHTSPTAEFSSTATTSITPADFEEGMDFTAEVDFTAVLRAAVVSPHRSMDSRHCTPSPATTRARSADLIMEEQQEGSPLADRRALLEVSTEAEDFTVVAVVTVAVVTGKSDPL
jgi:hypothetical protein